MQQHILQTAPSASASAEVENPEVARARAIIAYTDTNLFLTGRAGTGKTTFLRKLRAELPKRMVVLAPTGIAAINAQGVTIHSFFQLPFSPFIPTADYSRNQKGYAMSKQKLKLIRSLDLLVIDEISMVRADLLDAVDAALRRYRRDTRPFGGLQLLLIGDLQQLAPVVKEEEWELLSQYYDTPFFFSSRALAQTNYATIELQHVYRQSDSRFLNLLNAVREGTVTADVLQALNSRCVPHVLPEQEQGRIRLVTHNWQAQSINQRQLEALAEKEFTYAARVEGKFPELSYPTEATLHLKLGAQVMFVKNDPNKRFFNGMIGRVTAIDEKSFVVTPNEKPNERIPVEREEWTNTRYALDEATGAINEVVDGKFIQYPVKLAWAITIHKSQGLTFDRVMIDASGAFAHGQTYVALSRCRTLEGIILSSPIPASAIIADKNIDEFNEEMEKRAVTDERICLMQKTYGKHLLSELFGFERERKALAYSTRLLQEFLSSTYAESTARFEQAVRDFQTEVVGVASRFALQYTQLLESAEGDFSYAALQERLAKAAAYFNDRLSAYEALVNGTVLEIDNAQVRKRWNTTREELLSQLQLHLKLLTDVMLHGFSVSGYLSVKAKAQLAADGTADNHKPIKNAAQHATRGKASSQEEEKLAVPSEVVHPELYNILRQWRMKVMKREGLPAYMVVSTRAMMSMANYIPTDKRTLLKMPYFGAKTYEKYGEELLAILCQYAASQKG